LLALQLENRAVCPELTIHASSSAAPCEISVKPMFTILLILLVLLLIGALPTWPYSSGWGYYPSGGLGLVLLIVLVLFLMGRI
jgi:Protein of unknown function (DUF3309)